MSSNSLAPARKKKATGTSPEDESKFRTLWAYLHAGGYYVKVDIDNMMPSRAYMDAHPEKKWALAMFAHDHAAQLLAEAHEVLVGIHKENPSACTPACPHKDTRVHLCGCPQTEGCAQCEAGDESLDELKDLLIGLNVSKRETENLLSKVSGLNEGGTGAKKGNGSLPNQFT